MPPRAPAAIPPRGARPAWEASSDDDDDGPAAPWDDSSSSAPAGGHPDASDSDEEEMATPGDEFVQHMLSVLFIRKITAKD